jgi:hypothetical protein
MPDEELHDLSEHDLPEVGPEEKEAPDRIVVSRRPDGAFGWSRRDGTSDEVLDGSDRGYETEADAVDQALRRYPDLTVTHAMEGTQ